MDEQITWYLLVSSLFAAPAFGVAVVQWWAQNKEAYGPAVSVTRIGIFIAVLAFITLEISLGFTSRHPQSYGTFRVGCRWSALLFAFMALVCGLRGRGWMRFMLALFSAWLLVFSFWLLRATP